MMRAVAVVMLSLLVLGCRQKTESERLADQMSKWRYRGYRAASKKVVDAGACQAAAATNVVDAATIHGLLGLLWFVQEKDGLCYVEADLAEGPMTGDIYEVSLVLKTIALHRMEYPELSHTYYQKLKVRHARAADMTLEEVQAQHKVFLLALAIAGVVLEEPGMAKFAGDALGAICNVDYLGPLVAALAEASAGNYLEADKHWSEVKESESFLAHQKVWKQELADLMKDCKDKKDVPDEVVDRILRMAVNHVLEDIFSEENEKAVLGALRGFASSANAKYQSAQDAILAATEAKKRDAILRAVVQDVATNAHLKYAREFYGEPGSTNLALVSHSEYAIPWQTNFNPAVKGFGYRFVQEDARNRDGSGPHLLGIRLDRFGFERRSDSISGAPIHVTLMNAGGSGTQAVMGGCIVYYSPRKDGKKWTVEYKGSFDP